MEIKESSYNIIKQQLKISLVGEINNHSDRTYRTGWNTTQRHFRLCPRIRQRQVGEKRTFCIHLLDLVLYANTANTNKQQ